MHPLAKHEMFEVEVLDAMQRGGFLNPLVFVGGTMLRLCHDLPRYSVDLDFWFCRRASYEKYYEKIKAWLQNRYEVTDSKNKYYTLIYELRKKGFERKLKLEIRKSMIKKDIEEKIAFSSHSTQQVLLKALSLEGMFKRKILAIRGRNEIRDYYDIEFLLRKGVRVNLGKEAKYVLEEGLSSFNKTDFGVALGSLLPKDLRLHYVRKGFTYLREYLVSG